MADKEIWVCGDTNVDYKQQNSHEFKKTLRYLRHTHLKHLPMSATRLHKHGSTIDHIYTNRGKHVMSGNVNKYLNDHIPIYVIFKKVRNQHRKKELTNVVPRIIIKII